MDNENYEQRVRDIEKRLSDQASGFKAETLAMSAAIRAAYNLLDQQQRTAWLIAFDADAARIRDHLVASPVSDIGLIAFDQMRAALMPPVPPTPDIGQPKKDSSSGG